MSYLRLRFAERRALGVQEATSVRGGALPPRSIMISYPAAAERVAYNVPPGGLFEGSNLEHAPTAQPYSEVPLEPVRLREATLVHEYVHNAIATYAKAKRLPYFTDMGERTWDASSVGDPYGDRTVPVVFTLLEMVTEDFVQFSQSNILRKYPTWRLHHCEDGDRPELNLAIYPDAMSAGRRVPSANAAGQLSEWRNEVTEFREVQIGPLRRQLRRVEAALSAKPPAVWKNEAPVIVCAFDNCQGDGTVNTVWVVVRGTTPYEDDIDAIGLMEGSWYPVKKNGRVGELMGENSLTGLWVRQLVVPNEKPVEVSITRKRDRRNVTLTVNEFARDDT